MKILRKSRVAFVVIKLAVGGKSYFLMRYDPKWRDVNFIGGHVKDRDMADLRKTARRELWEEVPSVRPYDSIELEPLTSEVHYGPIHSRSRSDHVSYDLQFFLLKIGHHPEQFVQLLSLRSKNVWVAQDEMLNVGRFRISGLAKLLDESFPGGIAAIPDSSPTDLYKLRDRFENFDGDQLSFSLK